MDRTKMRDNRNKEHRSFRLTRKEEVNKGATVDPVVVFLKSVLTAVKLCLKTAFAIALLAGCIAGGLLIGVVAGCIITTEPLEEIDLYISGFTSFIYDTDNNVIGQLKGSQNINRVLVDVDDVPQDLLDAFVSIEDERFYTHPGVDVKRTVSAFLGYIVPGMSDHGGSTITQQVVKNVTGDDWQSIPRKIREIWRAYQLEKDYEKREILELYVNVIYMGSDLYGVKTASEAYFKKDVSELNLAECAFLAGITNNPGRYNPFTVAGRAHCYKRQINILDKMLELEYISDDEYIEAIQTELVFNEEYKKKVTTAVTTYFVDKVILDVRDALMDKGYTKAEANKIIYNTGIKIYSTQNTKIQTIVDEEFNNIDNFPVNHLYTSKSDMAQASIVIMDQTNGHVLAMYGGYGEKEQSLSYNYAINAQRQPGSSIKPILVYAPLIDQHIITAGSVVDDLPSYLNYQKPEELWPSNSYKSYYGLMNVRWALAVSSNVVATKLYADHVTLGLTYLKKLGIDRTDETQLAVILGGLTKGVSALNMCAAYVPFANSGVYYEPITFTKIYDKDGNLLLDNTPETTVVYEDYRTPAIMTNLLQEVTATGTAKSIKVYNKNGDNIPVAGKTGTTSSTYDYWFVGYTPYYTTAVWYGYDKQKSITAEEKGSAMNIWSVVMNRAHAELAAKDFSSTPGLVTCDICKYSGMLASDICYMDPRRNAVIKETFMSGTQPVDKCTLHCEKQVCIRETDLHGKYFLASEFCDPSTVRTAVGTLRTVPQDALDAILKGVYVVDWVYEFTHSTEPCPICRPYIPPVTQPNTSPPNTG